MTRLQPPARVGSSWTEDGGSRPATVTAMDASVPVSGDAARLAAILDAPPPAAAPSDLTRATSTEAGDVAWSSASSSMHPAEVRHLLERILGSPSITSGPFPGLTVSRLRPLLEPGYRSSAAIVLAWLDRAHLLEAPASASEPFRHPRALRSTDLEHLAARLAQTPVPDTTQVTTPDHRLTAMGVEAA